MNAKQTFFTFALLLALVIASSAQAQELKKKMKFSDHKWIPFYNLKKAGNTAIFQGNKKKKKYFEGWYFKLVSHDGRSIISVIPGISLSNDGEEEHAFIQLIDGVTAQTSYYSFPIDEFSFSRKEFAVKIGENYFSKDRLILHIGEIDSIISGDIRISNTTDYSNGQMISPGIMGWYRFIPFMQCYHGVVSLTHDLSGQLQINGNIHNFDQGKGYIEKDWGSSMPSSWIWIQSNHFADSETSFMLSIADVPFIGKSFKGFLGFLYYNNEVYRFATYRNSTLQLQVLDSNSVKIIIKNRKNTFVVEAKRNSMGMLKAPFEGSMDRRIPESIDASLKITMLDKKGSLIYSDSTKIAGFEMVDDFKSLEGTLN